MNSIASSSAQLMQSAQLLALSAAQGVSPSSFAGSNPGPDIVGSVNKMVQAQVSTQLAAVLANTASQMSSTALNILA